jgi:2-pyrone-4,6-dicarboxylate lactonase
MSPGYIPFHPNPSKPAFKPPAGAVDAHCHVFGPEDKFPYAPERKYTPCDAPKEKLLALRDYLGFDKNVIVQASCHSKDNRAMVDALEASDNKAKGIAFVGEEVTDDELKAMDRAGVRGVRFNFLRRLVDITPRDVLTRIASRVAPLGWHIVVYRSHGHADRRQGRRRPGEPALPAHAGEASEHLEQGDLPGAHDACGLAL